MDKLSEKTEEKTKKKGLFDRIKEKYSSQKLRKKEIGREEFLRDILFFSLGFVLSRCHIFFAARPVGIAFVAMLPYGVWAALVGCALGGITLGIEGVVFAAASVVTVLIRAAVSSGDKDDVGRRILFKESLLTRMAISVLGGFITALYRVLQVGLDESSILFGLTMIIITPLLTFGLAGIFSTKINLGELAVGRSDLLSLSIDDRSERYDIIFFHFSALLLIFLTSLSFRGVDIMGISVSYIFSGAVTLLTAKRFGALRGGGVGFVSSLAISPELSASFALMGLGSGMLFGLGTTYALIMGGVALCAWSIYTDRMTGLLSTLPEYLISAAIVAPMLKGVRVTEEAKEEKKKEENDEIAQDMVGTMALSYQSRHIGGLDLLSGTLASIGEVIAAHTKAPIRLNKDEYREVVISVAEEHCIGCRDSAICTKVGIRPAIKSADRLSDMLCEGKKITAADIGGESNFCSNAGRMAEEINLAVEREEKERRLVSEQINEGEEYRMISSLMAEIEAEDEEERRIDNDMTKPLTEATESYGIKNSVIRAFGKRNKRFFLAGEDGDGSKITSFELRKSIENAVNLKLSTPEYFKRGNMVLMDCGIKPKLHASYATVAVSGKDDEISGDTAICFESENGRFYSLISDGMGSGELARETSRFAADFIKAAAEIGATKEGVIHMLNHSLRSRDEECSATIDLFELDLLCGSGLFVKSGAAPSFVKRGTSIFRIRSQTAPIGLLRSIDSEKIRLEIKSGDHVIMLSDGITDSAEDAAWLLLLLGEEPPENLNDYALLILNEAIKNKKSTDDMTVTVIRVD